MRSKLLPGAATLALAALVVVVAGPATPQNWQHYGNATAGAPDFTAGMVGSTLAPASPFWGTGYHGNYRGHAYAPRYLYVPRYDYRPRR